MDNINQRMEFGDEINSENFPGTATQSATVRESKYTKSLTLPRAASFSTGAVNTAGGLRGGGRLMKVFEEKASAGLAELGLTTAAAQLDTVSQQAAAESWSYTEFLGYLLDGEIRQRHQTRVEMSLQFARFPYLKRLAEFDFKAQPAVDKRLVEELSTGRFLSEGRNIIFLGSPGVGKTHLAIALGVMTAELGNRVYFTTAIYLARKLTRAMHENRLSREMKNLTRPKLLIVDEVGYLKLEQPEASLVF